MNSNRFSLPVADVTPSGEAHMLALIAGPGSVMPYQPKGGIRWFLDPDNRNAGAVWLTPPARPGEQWCVQAECDRKYTEKSYAEEWEDETRARALFVGAVHHVVRRAEARIYADAANIVAEALTVLNSNAALSGGRDDDPTWPRDDIANTMRALHQLRDTLATTRPATT
ncbi:hypothetical protein ACFWGI_35620 [Streptomyces niveus]|uniref:hypothetical protein n=1 Tax=Streptomyces niveus TaxID=193462 RepID=UPI00364F80EF